MYFRFLIFLTAIIFSFERSTFSQELTPEVQEALETCNSCHGNEMLAEDPEVPVISGQSLQYIYRQLKDYKSSSRSHEIMTEMASSLEKNIMLELATYFSEQKWTNFVSKEKFNNKLAEEIISAGQCSQCHGTYKEKNLAAPRLGGQKVSYLVKTMLAFKNRTRKNAPDKSSLFQTMSDDAIKALAIYLSGK